jgi:hypothetical protein
VSSADLHVVETTFECRFDPHSLPPFFNNLQTGKSLANQFGFGRAICTTLEWASCISFETTSPYTFMVVRMSRDASVFIVRPPSSRRHPATSDMYASCCFLAFLALAVSVSAQQTFRCPETGELRIAMDPRQVAPRLEGVPFGDAGNPCLGPRGETAQSNS